jgi:peptide chain release factor 2
MNYGGIFELETKLSRYEEVLAELEEPSLWNKPDLAQAFAQEKVALERILLPIESLTKSLQDIPELIELGEDGEDGIDRDLFEDIEADLAGAEKQIAELEFQRMFAGPVDANNAFIEIQSGSGGTEAQDWAEMLLRMYLRWAEREGFKAQLLEVSDGEVAGIKGATVKVEGPYAYGWLRTETGVHRLVRKSPFDSGNRRHTSFAAVFISPEVDTDIDITINPADLRIDTYRASGAGGQHINRTDSAVRITHVPTGVVVQCQSDRSQHKNRSQAMSQLKSKLYELELHNRNQEKEVLEASKSDITWGSQIRSYVLDSSRIKDLRTGVETSDTQGVLDGNLLTMFIQASLKQGVQND